MTTADISLHLHGAASVKVVKGDAAWNDDKMDRLLQPKQLASGKLTWQWKMALLKMYSLFENGDFPLSC